MSADPPSDDNETSISSARQKIDSAASLAASGTTVEPGTRFRRTKGLALRLLRVVTRDQARFNAEVVAALRHLVDVNEQGLRSLTASMDQLASAAERMDAAHAKSIENLAAAVGEAEHRIGALRTEVHSEQSRLDTLLTEARKRLPEPLDTQQLEVFAEQLAGRLDAVMMEFADIHRGTFDEISERLAVHLPTVGHLADGELELVDIGSGRGEWLALLAAEGIPAYGLDTNALVVEEAAKRDLDIRREDALEHLREVPEGTVGAITGFHIIEHLPLSVQIELLDACLLALSPGGPLILESPNPTNIVVGASSFYVDPTHERPVHPQLLEFLVRQRGFVDIQTVYLNSEDDRRWDALDADGTLKPMIDYLNNSFFGPRDFAVIGRKAPLHPGPAETPDALTEP